jgi:hypothetical protein
LGNFWRLIKFSSINSTIFSIFFGIFTNFFNIKTNEPPKKKFKPLVGSILF